MEMDLTRGEGRRERFMIDPGQHQDPAVGAVLDDRRDEAGSIRPGHGRRIERRGGAHAARPGVRRTASPASAMAALIAPIEWIRRWKIEAARTASAPPSRMARTKSAGPAAPPDAITGTG